MDLSEKDIKILVGLLENRLNADYDPDVADLLYRLKKYGSLIK